MGPVGSIPESALQRLVLRLLYMVSIFHIFRGEPKVGNIESVTVVLVVLDSEIVRLNVAMDILSHFVHLLYLIKHLDRHVLDSSITLRPWREFDNIVD